MSSTALAQLIKQKIITEGPISFAEFMSLALYHPELGYYTRRAIEIGKAGDFITSATLSPLFAQCLARQFLELKHQIKTIDTIIEYGAGTGELANNILQYLITQQALPTHYKIIEISPALRQKQQILLAATLPAEVYQCVQWVVADDLQNQHALIIANEVLDAFPVHLVGLQAAEPFERYVACVNDELVWNDQPITDLLVQQAWQACVDDQHLTAPYLSEINLELTPWLATIKRYLTQGLVLLIDYGFSAQEYYHADRLQGTLMCHHQHRAHTDPLIHIGEQDLTAHVDFSAVAQQADQQGLQPIGYTDQANYLLGLGLLECLQTAMTGDLKQDWLLAQQIKQLTLPHEMGELFKVLGLAVLPATASLQFAGFSRRNVLDRLR